MHMSQKCFAAVCVSLVILQVTSVHAASMSISPTGRLGNIMFQYASAYGIARQAGTSLCVHADANGRTFSQLQTSFQMVAPPTCRTARRSVIEEKGYALHDMTIIAQVRKRLGLVEVMRYMQSWKYFDAVEHDVRTHFVFKPAIVRQARFALASLHQSNKPRTKIVGIHVRRGDYIAFGYLNFPPASYFEAAMAQFPAHTFVVVSLETKWCKMQHFFANNNAVTILPAGRTAAVDMAILSLCDGIILTLGTFGWWAAWLAKDARVIYYDNMFKLDHPVNKGKVRYKDHFLLGWTALGDRPTTNNWNRFLPSTNVGPDWCPSKNSAGSKFVLSQYAKVASKFAEKCNAIKRVGGDGDGGKLICTDFIQKNNCIVYSLGSRLDFSFEIDIVNQFKCRVHTFDCTVGTVKSADIPPGVVFHPWCVGGKNEEKRISSDLGHQGETGQYYTLGTIRAKLGHKSVDLLKMDIERHEFAVIATLTGANVPQQIAFETHLHNAYGMWGRPVQKGEWIEMWTTLTGLGFRIFSHEPNPSCLCCCEFSINRAALPTKKKSVPNTIVTAYFRLSSKHSPKEYDAWMFNMLSLQDAMVIYTTVDMVSQIKRLRSHATDLTLIVPIALKDTRMGSRYDAAFWKKQHLMDPEMGIHTDARMYWVWNEKAEFLWRTVGSNPFQSTFFAWVDIGYFRTSEYNGQYMIRHIPANLGKDQVLMLDVSSLIDTKRWGNYVGGGFIGGYAAGIRQWHTKYYAQLHAHEHEFIGKEQPWMWKTCDANPDLCELVIPKQGHGDPWFYMAPYLNSVVKWGNYRRKDIYKGRSDALGGVVVKPHQTGNVSVVVPAIGSDLDANLQRLLRSVDAQTTLPTEVIVVASGVADARCTRDLQQGHRFAVQIKCLRMRVNQATARNIGIDLANGEWVSFIDSDDEMLPERVAALVDAKRANPALRLFLHGWDNGKPEGTLLRGKALYNIAKITQGQHDWVHEAIMHSQVSVHRNVGVRFRESDDMFRKEDSIFVRDVIQYLGGSNDKMLFDPRPLGHHRPRFHEFGH